MTSFLTFYIIVILFNNALSRLIPTSLLDEISFFIILIIGICIQIKNKLDIRTTFKIWMLLFGIGFLGILSTIMYKYQTNPYAIFKDWIMLIKAPLTFAYGLIIFKYVDSNKVLNQLIKIIKVLTVVIFVFGIVNIFFDINMDSGFRNGIRTYKFLFKHPTFLVYTLVIFIVLLFTKKKNSLYILLNIVSLILTFRDKAYIFIVAFLFVCTYRFMKDKESKLIFINVGSILAIVLLFILSYDKLMDMYIIYGTRTARGALYLYGLEYAILNFPFGTGFATWGTSISGEYYSVLYFEKNMQYIEGISPDNTAYITDTFWPFIYTEFGFIGFILYILIYLYIIKIIFKESKNNERIKLSSLFLLMYAFIASLFEGFFTNESGVFTMIILCLLIGCASSRAKSNKKMRED